MRLELEPQIMELRASQTLFELRRASLPVIQHRQANDDRVTQHLDRKFHEVAGRHLAVIVRSQAEQREQHQSRAPHYRRRKRRERDQYRNMDKKILQPRSSPQREAPRHPDNHGNDGHCAIGAGELFNEANPRRLVPFARKDIEIVVPEFKKSERVREREEDQARSQAPVHRTSISLSPVSGGIRGTS
jgi:hypothetical protein